MTMHRSWIVWLVSTFTFCVTVAVVIATGPGQPSSDSETEAQAEESDTDTVRLPQINAHEINAQGNDGITSSEVHSTAATENLELSPAAAQPSTSQVNGINKATLNRGGRAALSATKAATAKTTTAKTTAPDTTAIAQAQAVVGISYQPKEVVTLAHPSNYGERYTHDASGNPVDNDYIVVLHETVGSASSALNTFLTNHPRDEDQVSYHTLIGLDGTIYYVVPPEQRAFGAGDSVFKSFQGEESVFTNAEFPSSVNNFAYHISLETPLDGQNNNSTYHSGYTEAQYQSLAWLLARTNIPDDRITTHRTVDRSGSRMDPRSFEADRMYRILRQYPSRQQAG